MKQNGVVCLPGPALLFFIFDLNIWFRARKLTGTFEKRAPGPFACRLNDQNCADSCFCFLLVYTKTVTFDLTTDSKLEKRKRHVNEEIKQRANIAKRIGYRQTKIDS